MKRKHSSMTVRSDGEISPDGRRRVELVNLDVEEAIWEIVMSHNGDELQITRAVVGEGLVVTPQATNVIKVRYDA